jgi:UDP-N-acetylglucosamine--N-acetylmuramyl-(pentapeptide) pyrophosphoryl-undecaprenol N-acetylglucosamine transferase
LGAGRLNEAVIGVADRWSSRQGIAVYHVVGARNADWAAAAAAELSLGSEPGGLVYVQVAYEDHMEYVYAACDLAVCRSGANTVAELTVTGTPALLVPLPGAPGDHQNANASVLAEVGAAVVVQDRELDASRLSLELERLLAEPGRLEKMADAAYALGRPDAAEAVADLASRHARHRDPVASGGKGR